MTTTIGSATDYNFSLTDQNSDYIWYGKVPDAGRVMIGKSFPPLVDTQSEGDGSGVSLGYQA